MVQGQLRVAVIGAQTQSDGKKPPYTVYRTVVNFHGQCYQRLLRYREFHKFNDKLRLRHKVSKNTPEIVFPKREWTRKLSLEEDVIEARQVLLNEYMNQVTQNELTPGCYDRLLRLLKVGDYDVETKGHPAPHKSPHSGGKGERPTVDVLRDMENEEADDKIQQYRKQQDEAAKSRRENGGAPTDRIGGAAMIVNTSAVYRAATSNAETVLTEDECSMDERQEDTEDPLSDEQEDEFQGRASMAPSSAMIPNKHFGRRSQLRSAVSAPTQRAKKVKFVTVEDENPAAEERHMGDLSPERKYGPKIKKQISNIDSILSEYSSADGHAIPPEFHSESAILARNRAESL